MSSQIFRSASRAARSIVSSASKQKPRLFSGIISGSFFNQIVSFHKHLSIFDLIAVSSIVRIVFAVMLVLYCMMFDLSVNIGVDDAT